MESREDSARSTRSDVQPALDDEALRELLKTFDGLQGDGPAALEFAAVSRDAAEVTLAFATKGSIMKAVFNDVYPDWFGGIQEEPQTLVKALEHMMNDEYQNLMSKIMREMSTPTENSPQKLGLLLGEALIVACVVTEFQEVFVNRVLGLSEATQLAVQNVIQRHVGAPNDWGEDDEPRSGEDSGRDDAVTRRHSVLHRLTSRHVPTGSTVDSAVGGGRDPSLQPSHSSLSSSSEMRDGPKVPPLALDGIGGSKRKKATVGWQTGAQPSTVSNGASTFGEAQGLAPATMVPKPGGSRRPSAYGDDEASMKKLSNLREELHKALSEKDELVTALEKAEGRIQAEVDKAALALQAQRQKFEETQAKQMESVQDVEAKIEELQKAKLDAEMALREKEKEFEAQKKRLLDDMDSLASSANRVPKLEKQVEKYAQMINDLQGEKSKLQSQVESQLEVVRAANSTDHSIEQYKKNVDQYKDKVANLESELTMLKVEKEEAAKQTAFFKSQQEATEEKLKLSQKRYDAYVAEVEAEKYAREELISNDSEGGAGLQKKVARLERENEMLKAGGKETQLVETVAKLKNELDDAQRAKDQMEKNLQAVTAKNSYLTAQIETPGAGGSGASDEEILRLRGVEQKYTELNDQFFKTKDQWISEKQKVLELEAKLNNAGGGGATAAEQLESEKEKLQLTNKITNLEMQLESAQSSLAQEKEKGEMRGDSIRNKLEVEFSQALSALREQLRMRDKALEYNQTTNRYQLKQQRREQNLMASQFHEVVCRFFNEKSEKEKIQQEFDALLLKVQQRRLSDKSAGSETAR